MKPKMIVILWIAATVTGLLGVYLFVSTSTPPVISRMIMLVGIVLSLTWIVGLAALIYRKVFRNA